jgi:5'-nucleotidase
LCLAVVFLGAVAIGLAIALGVVAATKKTETTTTTASAVTSDDIVWITILQLNDVYEIDGVNHGTEGGLARVATFRKQLLAKNPNTYTMIAGDFISPSAMGTATVADATINKWAFSTQAVPGVSAVKNDTTLGGIQVVDVLNYLGVDYATLGNHEFDNKERVLRRRLEDANFKIINCNAFNTTLLIDQNKDGAETNSTRLFNKVVPSLVVPVNGTTIKMGIVGAVIDPVKSMTRVLNSTATVAAVKAQVVEMKSAGVQIIVALTHQALSDDSNLAAMVPDIDIIVGGHEHDNYYAFRGVHEVPVYRADANARTVYVHDIFYNKTSGKTSIQSRLQHINSAFASDPAVQARVDYWTTAAFNGFNSSGFNATKAVANLPVPYNVLDSYVRSQTMPIGQLVADALLNYPAAKAAGAQLAFFNGGAFRLDDTLDSGSITQYDVLRLLPFVNVIQVWNLTSANLAAILDSGYSVPGNGQFIQVSSVVTRNPYKISGVALNITSPDTWMVASIDFLWNSGIGSSATNMKDNKISLGSPANTTLGDMRQAVMDYMTAQYPPS